MSVGSVSQVPGPLTSEIELKKAEKKRAQKALKKHREKEQREERKQKEEEELEKRRYAALGEREKVSCICKKNTAIHSQVEQGRATMSLLVLVFCYKHVFNYETFNLVILYLII